MCQLTTAFPRRCNGKESACQYRRCGFDPGLGRSPRGGNGNPLQYSCQEISHGQRGLVCYSPQGQKMSATPERMSTSMHTHINYIGCEPRPTQHTRVRTHTHTHTHFKLLAFYILSHISNLGLHFTCDFSGSLCNQLNKSTSNF